MDVPVEAPGTPVASSARGLDGLNDITVPAKAAMLEARVAELEVSMNSAPSVVLHQSFKGAEIKMHTGLLELRFFKSSSQTR